MTSGEEPEKYAVPVAARLEVCLVQSGLRSLKELQAMFDNPQHHDIVNRALILYAFIEQETRAGNTLCLGYPDGSVHEVTLTVGLPPETETEEG